MTETKGSKRLMQYILLVAFIIFAALAAVLVIGRVEDPAPITLEAVAETPVVRYVNFRVYDPVYVGLEKGFFEERGITVEIIGDVLAGPTGIQAVASGSAEAGLSSLPAIVNANAAGLPIYGSSDIQSALPGQPLEVYYVLNDSPIEDIGDLADSTFAVNLWRSSFHYTALMALEQAGVSEEDVEFVLLSFANQPTALLAGDVDVIGLMEPYIGAFEAEYGDEARVLFDAADVFGEKQFTTHFVNRLWAEYNPEQATAFTDGIVDAIAWIETNQDEAKGIIASYTGIDEEFVPEYHFQENGKVVTEDVAFWLDYLIGRGDVTAEWLIAEEIAGNTYNSLEQ